MNLEPSSLSNNEIWQRMAVMVHHHPAAKANLSREFKKIVIYRLLSENLLVFLLQYIGLMLSTLTPHPAPLWLSSGTACAFIFLRGKSVLPGIWLGSFIAYALVKYNLLFTLEYASIHAAQAFLLLWLSHRYISPTLIFYNRSTLIKFILCCSLLTAVMSLLLAYPLLQKTRWIQMWLADLNGILIFAIALVTWDVYYLQLSALKTVSIYKLSMIYGSLLLLLCALFFSTGIITLGISFAILLLTIQISLHFGRGGAVAAMFLQGMLFSLAAYLGAPLFTQDTSLPILITPSGLLVLCSLSGLFITAKN